MTLMGMGATTKRVALVNIMRSLGLQTRDQEKGKCA